MTLHLVPNTARAVPNTARAAPNTTPAISTAQTAAAGSGSPAGPERPHSVTDPASGLTVQFDGFVGGTLIFEINECCCHDHDEFQGAAMLQLAVAADTPIQWRVPHHACAERIAAVLTALRVEQITICAPRVAA